MDLRIGPKTKTKEEQRGQNGKMGGVSQPGYGLKHVWGGQADLTSFVTFFGWGLRIL